MDILKRAGQSPEQTLREKAFAMKQFPVWVAPIGNPLIDWVRKNCP